MNAVVRPTGWPLAVGAVAAALAASTLLIAVLEGAVDIQNGSAVYLVAVSAIAIFLGTWPAVATALGAFVLYNFFFVEPRFTLVVSRPQQLLTLVVLLFAGIVIGRLAGLERERRHHAQRREREAQALFAISRDLVRTERLSQAMEAVAPRLAEAAGMKRVWMGVGSTIAGERVLGEGRPTGLAGPGATSHFVLHRGDTDDAGHWVRIRPPTSETPTGTGARDGGDQWYYRVELRAADEVVGSLWAERERAELPRMEETRLLAAAADHLGAALRRDRLLARAAELEVVRRGDELKSAILDSVSHDLRTPLATIRAAAGSLADPSVDLPIEDRRSTAAAIDAEADRLSRLVDDLLDMSRIQGGALVPDLEIVPVEELVRPAVERRAVAGTARTIEADLPADLPDVLVDAALLDRVLDNLLDNAERYADDGATIRVTAARDGAERVALTVEDGGPGVADDSLDRIFERFDRLGPRGPSRGGFGLGLAIVRGFTEAMDGTVSAGRSELGGLAVTLRLPVAEGRGS